MKQQQFYSSQRDSTRIDEAKSLKWTNIDLERGIITLNNPQKISRQRMFKISSRLVGMLNAFPKDKGGPFKGHLMNLYRDFHPQRKNITKKLQNPRIENNVPYAKILESCYGIRQNKRYPLRHALAWT